VLAQVRAGGRELRGTSGVASLDSGRTTPSSAGCPGVVHGNGNDGSKITIRELLQHTSGLPKQVSRRIIVPLGLHHTYAPGTSTRLPRPHATGYQQRRRPDPVLERHRTRHLAAAGADPADAADRAGQRR
jgi:hypothetical protein